MEGKEELTRAGRKVEGTVVEGPQERHSLWSIERRVDDHPVLLLW